MNRRKNKRDGGIPTMAISVLIVEDDKNIAELLQMYLEKEGMP